MVHKAVVVPILLYGSEMWTGYSRHHKALEQYHQCYQCKILRIYAEERCTNTSILDQANTPSIKHGPPLIGYDGLGTSSARLTRDSPSRCSIPSFKLAGDPQMDRGSASVMPQGLTGEVWHSHRHLGITGPRQFKVEEEHLGRRLKQLLNIESFLDHMLLDDCIKLVLDSRTYVSHYKFHSLASQYSVNINKIPPHATKFDRVLNRSSHAKPFIPRVILVNLLQISSNGSTSFLRYGAQN
eukprot:g32456.t1